MLSFTPFPKALGMGEIMIKAANGFLEVIMEFMKILLSFIPFLMDQCWLWSVWQWDLPMQLKNSPPNRCRPLVKKHNNIMCNG